MSWIDNSPLTIWGVEPYGGAIADPDHFREAMSRLGAAVHIISHGYMLQLHSEGGAVLCCTQPDEIPGLEPDGDIWD